MNWKEQTLKVPFSSIRCWILAILRTSVRTGGINTNIWRITPDWNLSTSFLEEGNIFFFLSFFLFFFFFLFHFHFHFETIKRGKCYFGITRPSWSAFCMGSITLVLHSFSALRTASHGTYLNRQLRLLFFFFRKIMKFKKTSPPSVNFSLEPWGLDKISFDILTISKEGICVKGWCLPDHLFDVFSFRYLVSDRWMII